MSVGLCEHLGLETSLTALEVVPFLVVAIGLDNMTIITKSVVTAAVDKPVCFRVAEVKITPSVDTNPSTSSTTALSNPATMTSLTLLL